MTLEYRNPHQKPKVRFNRNQVRFQMREGSNLPNSQDRIQDRSKQASTPQIWQNVPDDVQSEAPASEFHQLLMYSVGKVRGHSNKTRRHDRNYDLSRRLKAVNDYFEEKAAEVLVDEASVEQLLKLYERIALEHEELEINSAGKALARLAAAGFCEVHETTVQITKDGLKFIESFDQPESE